MTNFNPVELADIAAAVEAIKRPAPSDEIASKVARIVQIAQDSNAALFRMVIPGASWHVKEVSSGVYAIAVRGTNTDRVAFMLNKRHAQEFARAILDEIGE